MTPAAPPEYIRPTISASRLKSIGGEKGSPGCERKTAGAYLFDMRQAASTATDFGSALHAMAEHYQVTGEIIEPESDVARVFSAGAHLLSTTGPMLVEYEHIGTLPDGSPYVAYIDGHSDGLSATSTVVIQDIKTTSNQRYALEGADSDDPAAVAGAQGPYALRLDLQAMFYAWILLCDAHWYAPQLPSDAHQGPRHWQWWDPAARGAANGPGGARTGLRSGRLRWIYFLTKGVPRSWEANDWATPDSAARFMADTILPLVAKINALHEWHHRTPGASLDQIDRTLAACSNRGRWCGVHERNACNFDQLGTPALDLVQLKVRKNMTPQERLAALKNKKANEAAAAQGGPAPATPAPALVTEAPAASPPAPPAVAPQAAALASAAPAEPSGPAPVVSAEPAVSSVSSAKVADASASAAPVAAAGELTRGQKAAATRAARAAAAASAGAGINPPESAEAVAKLTAEQPEPVPPTAPLAPAEKKAIQVPVDVDVSVSVGKSCPPAADLAALLSALVGKVPVGVTITIEGQR